MTYQLIAPLHDYQRQAAKHVLSGKGNALFLEMGLGKTLTTLEILNHRLVHGKTNRILILAPKRICEQVWRQEAKLWGYPLSVAFLSGSPAKRLAELKRPQADVYLMTYENLIWLEGTGLFPFDTVVLDELSKMKNSGSKRWRAFKRLNRRYNPFTLGLTGTPSPNGYDDLWAQMHCLDQGQSLGPVKGRFLSSYFNNISRDPTRYSKFVLKAGAEQMINARLRKAGVLSMRARDVLGQQAPTILPSLRIRLPSNSSGIYEELESELMATMPNGRVVLPEHEATVQIKLRQVSSGFMLDEDKSVHRLHTAKVDALRDYVEAMAGEPLMVVYTFQEELKMLQETLGADVPYLGGGVSTGAATKAIDDWNAGELPVLLVQPQAAGHGLNLQRGGHHILFYSTDWNLETYQQVIARLNRQGQTSPVFVRHMVAGDVEDGILAALADKAGLQDHLMDNLREKATG